MNRGAERFHPISNDKFSFYSAINEAGNKILFHVGRKNNAVIKKNVRPGNSKVDICAGFCAERNVNAPPILSGEINYRAVETAKYLPPCSNDAIFYLHAVDHENII